LLIEAACSFAVKHREEMYGGLWLRFAQKFSAKAFYARGCD
jgi:hypothetical protein